MKKLFGLPAPRRSWRNGMPPAGRVSTKSTATQATREEAEERERSHGSGAAFPLNTPDPADPSRVIRDHE
jgi:hypothetical protein